LPIENHFADGIQKITLVSFANWKWFATEYKNKSCSICRKTRLVHGFQKITLVTSAKKERLAGGSLKNNTGCICRKKRLAGGFLKNNTGRICRKKKGLLADFKK
jgi:hypothetical protein